MNRPILLVFSALLFAASVAIICVFETRGLLVIAALAVAPAGLILAPIVARDGMRAVVGLFGRLAWFHFLWFCAFLSTLVFRARDTSDIRDMPIDAWAAYRVGLMVIVGLALGLIVRRIPWPASMGRGLIGVLTLYAVFSILSTAWSAYRPWTAYKSVEYTIDLALMAAIVHVVRSSETYKSLLDCYWTMLFVLLLTVWLGTVLWPEQALLRGSDMLGPRICGVLPAMDQDTVGEYAALLSLVGVTRLVYRRGSPWLYGAVTIFSVVTLFRTQTRITIVGFVVGLVLVLALARRWRLLFGISALIGLLVALTSVVEVSKKAMDRNDNKVGVETLSGRTPRWEVGFRMLMHRPLIGYGAYAGQRFAVGPEFGDTQLADVLNTYLDVGLGTGVVGVTLFVIVLVGTWTTLLRGTSADKSAFDRYLSVEAAGALVVITGRSWFTTTIVSHAAFATLTIVMFAEFLRRKYAAGKGTVRVAAPGAQRAAWALRP